MRKSNIKNLRIQYHQPRSDDSRTRTDGYRRQFDLLSTYVQRHGHRPCRPIHDPTADFRCIQSHFGIRRPLGQHGNTRPKEHSLQCNVCQRTVQKSTETTWQDATVSNDKTMATIAPEWSEASPYQINPDKGVFAATTYDYKLDIDGTEFTGQFTTAPGMTIANGNMDTWYFEDAWYPHSDATTGNLWATGNPGTKLIKDNSTKNPVNLTTPVEHESKQAAYLKSQLIEGKVLGFVSVTKFGAGNLFVGDFGEIVYSPQGAKVKFGKEYEFTARPTGLKLKYKNTVGNINYIGSKTGVSESDIDKARIFVCLCNWSGQHTVDTTKEATYFDPTDPNKQASEGEVIGYGDLQIGETHTDWTEVTIPIVYNDKINKPGYNKNLIWSSLAQPAFTGIISVEARATI